MSRQDLLKELFEKYLNDRKMTPGEIRQLQALVQDERNRALLDQLMASLYEEEAREPGVAESNSQAAFEEVWAKLQAPAPAIPAGSTLVYGQFRRRWWRYAAAAVVILAAGASAFWLFRDHTATPIVQQNQPAEPAIQPGGNKAILTLADGSTIGLDTASNGTLVQQGNVQIVKSKAGELAYQPAAGNRQSASGNEHPAIVGYNQLATPRGGRYTLTLPDGSKVWLNAASSIRYPTSFTGKERRVEITGEAYFEVEPLTHKGGQEKTPFIVNINTASGNSGEVRVLGTHFNINAYGDEAVIKATLLEGSVRVMNRQSSTGHASLQSVVLKPGQQAIIASSSTKSNESSPIMVQTADVEAAIAWKNGLIQFEGHDIHAAMRMLARWYNVEVEYRGSIPNAHFRGAIPSHVPVSQVLDMLEKTEEVHFEISGRKIIVTP